MRKFLYVLAGIALAAGITAGARADALADTRTPDNASPAKAAEQRGDLARIHNGYLVAAAEYRIALRIDPRNAALYNKLGVAEFQAGNKGLARKHFSQAVKLDPRDASALNNLGALSCVEKKYKPAVQYLKTALALDESNASAHLNLAEAWLGLDEADRAMAEYSRALELDADILTPNYGGVTAQLSTPEQRARVDYIIARMYAGRGNLEGALEYLQRAKEDHFHDLSRVYTDKEFAALWQDTRLQKIVKH